jgi:predicted MFS family arabinose efflux permease
MQHFWRPITDYSVTAYRSKDGAPAIVFSLAQVSTGAKTMYTYLSVFLRAVTGIHGAQIGYALFTWGASAGVGVLYGSKLVDRLGARAVTVPCLVLGGLAFVTLSLTAQFVTLWASILASKRG